MHGPTSTLLSAFAVSLLVPSAALQAQDPTLYGRGTAVVDGVESVDEWSAAATVTTALSLPVALGGSSPTAVFSFLSDDDHLFASVEFAMAGALGDEQFLVFAVDAWDGPSACGTVVDEQRVQLDGVGATYSDHVVATALFGDECVFNANGLDTGDGGTVDGAGAALFGEPIFFEVAVPLDSDDDDHDLSVAPPRKIALRFFVFGCHFGDCDGTSLVERTFFLGPAGLFFLGDFEDGGFAGWSDFVASLSGAPAG